MAFRDFLKDEMTYQGITTRELAEKSGINKRTLDNYLMSNPQEPSVTNAHKIALALGVSVEYLVTGKESQNSVPITGEILEVVREFSALTAEQRNLYLQLLKNLNAQKEKAEKQTFAQ